MKVLYISNNPLANKTDALTWFQKYCEFDDLYLYTDLEKAKDFLIENVINKQKHLDFIISDWNFGISNSKTLLDWVKNSDETYSSLNFQFRSLPFLIIEDPDVQSSLISEGFDEVIQEFPNDTSKLYFGVKSAIKAWRYLLAEDLELIGLDPKTMKEYPSQRNNFISYFRLNVLTRQFVDNKSKKLNYIWNSPDIVSLQNSNQQFYDKVYWTTINPPRYLEKEFHQFFLKYPTFIKGEDYISTENEMLYEKHLYYDNSRRYIEPDFINKPYEYSLRNPEIFEVKRHTQKLLRFNKENFLSNTKKSFQQVIKYKKYMNSTNPYEQNYVKKYLGKLYDNYEYTLLIGSLDEKLEYEDLIEKLKKDYDFGDINLLTYDELLDRHIKVCDRLSEFNIFD